MFNIFAIHYFLWFSAMTPIYGFIGAYALYYADVSTSYYGILSMILAFVSIPVKPFFCAIADRKQAHRTFFLFFLSTALFGYGSFGVLPFFLNPLKKENGLDVRRWIVICVMTTIATLSMAIITSLSDAFAVNMAKKKNSSYGLIRVWGTIGWALSSILIAFSNQIESLPYLVPGVLLTIVAIGTDIVLNVLWKDKDDYKLNESSSGETIDDVIDEINRKDTSIQSQSSNHKQDPLYASNDNILFKKKVTIAPNLVTQYGSTESQIITSTIDRETESEKISDLHMQYLLFKFVAQRRLSIFRYLILFTIAGALASLQWWYFMIYLEKIYPNEMPFFSGLSMLGQSLLGELPFFILAKTLINFLGRSHALSLSIATVGIRYLLYVYMLPASGYLVLVTEIFQGPNFGLFYVVLTSVGLDYSDCDDAILDVINKKLAKNNPAEIEKLRHSLRSFMMAIASASYEGLGVGLGSLIGGFYIEAYGFESLWLWSSIFAIALGLANSAIDILKIPLLIDKNSSSEIST